MNTNKNTYEINVKYIYIEPTVIYNNEGHEFIVYTWQDADVAIIKNNDVYVINNIKITF